MENQKTTIKWSQLYQKNVVDPKEGKIVGQVEDFFFKEGSNAIYALRVHTRVNGDYTLPVTGIKSIDSERVNVINPQMLSKAVPGHTLGQTLLARNVVTEKGSELGPVKDVLLGIEPIVAMRVAGLEVAHNGHNHGFTSECIARYNDDEIIIDEKVTRRIR